MNIIYKKLMRAVMPLMLVLSYLPSYAQLNGTYTIGGTTPNYASVTAAVTALQTSGVSGPVVFNIRNGSYAGQVTINAITGASATNTITFQSETATAANVTISFTPTATATNYVVKLNGASFVTFKNVTLKNTATATYGRVVELAGAASSNNITGCIVNSFATTLTTNTYALVYAASLTGNANTFSGNTFQNGAMGVYLAGTSTASVTADNVISGNTFTGQYTYGIYSIYTSNIKVNNNSISKTGAGTFYGIYQGYGNNAFEITGNTINNTTVTGTNYPLYVEYSNGTASARGRIALNNITVTSSTTVQNIIQYSNQYSFSRNTVNFTGSSTGTYSPLYNYNYSTTVPNPYGAAVNIDSNTLNATATASSATITLYGNYYGLGNGSFNNNTMTLNNLTGTKTIYYTAYCNNTPANNNTLTSTTSSTGGLTVYGQYYSNNVTYNNNKITYRSTGSGGLTIYGLYYALNSVGNNDTVDFISTGTGAMSNYFNGYSNNSTMQNCTVTASTTTGTLYTYANYYAPGSVADNFKVTHTSTTGGSYFYGPTYAPGATVKNSDVKLTTTTGVAYTYLISYSDNATCNNVKVNNTVSGGNTMYNYMQYSNNFTFTNNSITTVNGSSSTTYGLYNYHSGYSGGVFANNTLTSTSTGTGSTYALYGYYNTNVQFYNNVIKAQSGSTCYAGMNAYANGSVWTNNVCWARSTSSGTAYSSYAPYNYNNTYYYNNSFYSEGGSSTYTTYFYNSASYGTPVYRNNVFMRNGNGYLLGVYQDGTQLDMDYNTYFINGGSGLVYDAYNGLTYATMDAWKAFIKTKDRNSVYYNPGFTNATAGDLRPNPTNANSWALNGRGVQVPGNNKDINGNARADVRSNGVPDIGAYEFTPTSIPPDCEAIPIAPVANGTQVFRFGTDTAAVITWGATIPTGPFAVKQYTGTNPPGITSLNPTQMFYYADFVGTGTALDYKQNLYFKDAWLGTIPSKNGLHLAGKVGVAPWVGYPTATSVANITRNFIATTGVNDLGLFTGIDVKDNAGIDSIMEPKPVFCAGTYPVKVRVNNNGNNTINNVKITWEVDGVNQGTISYTTPIGIFGSPGGNTAIITLGNVTFGGAPKRIKVWTSLPNGNTDPIAIDDTLDTKYTSGLTGTYTVGGVNPDYPTVVDAAKALMFFGTCGDVTFNIRPGTYNGQVTLGAIPYAAGANRVRFQAENGVASSVIINHPTTASELYVFRFDNTSNVTLKNLTITATGTSVGRGIEMWRKSSNDSVIGCKITAPVISNSTNAALYAYGSTTQFNGDNLVLKGNTFEGGYYGMYIYGYTTTSYYLNGLVIDSNTVKPYYYGIYVYYSNGARITNNRVLNDLSTAMYYANYIGYAYQSPKIENNYVKASAGYGMYIIYLQGTAANKGTVENNVVASSGNGIYGIFNGYPTQCDILNNSVRMDVTSTSSYPYMTYMSSTAQTGNRVMNNAFANYGPGYAYAYWSTTGTTNMSNYNNLFTKGNSFAYDGYNGTVYATKPVFIAASKTDSNSITWDPGYMSTTDLHPNPANENSWSLNGRGFHIAGNNKDMDGNTRVENRADGTPDIGAYEFTPTSIPPLAKATPATAQPGQTQTYTFGDIPVTKITWNANFPLTAPLEVRQYSGERAPGIAAAASPKGSMYFYTTISAAGGFTTYDFDQDLSYMDIWLGNIANESELHLAHKFQNKPWAVYNDALSSANTTTNLITAPKLTSFGAFTGLENGAIPSAFVRPAGSVIICNGNSVLLNAEPQNGSAYQWYLNGGAISGATNKSYSASAPGDYSVKVTINSKDVESIPVTVSAIAPPNAIIAANNTLTYCPGSGLTLDAGTGSGLKYQWQLNGTDIPGATGNTYAVGSAGNYTVVVTNVGCSTTSTISTVSSGPLVANLGSDTTYCEIKNVFAKLDAGFPGARYIWSTGDTTRTIEVRQQGSYWVEVDAGPNCVDRDTIKVTIDPLPKANGISFVRDGNTYDFYPSGPVGAQGFLWLFSDGSTSTQTNPRKTIDGELYVRMVMFNACGSDTVQLGWPLGVEEVTGKEQVSVYPNPASDVVKVKVDGAKLKEVEVLNSVGAVVYKVQVSESQQAEVISISLDGIANGHYMLRAVTTSGAITKPFDVAK